MYILKFFVEMYPQLNTPPERPKKTEDEQKKDKKEKERRRELFLFKVNHWDLMNCFN
jgi:hypothetical protein